ncbi:MAG TPA: hypothetical protein PKH79_02860 [Prolixibacteraceae bacterium]|nr:hypothetical protein [Prolixibacteraceae bacterium]HPS14141.1 hypothetical protein [Prolixibacteraceae bacterium]
MKKYIFLVGLFLFVGIIGGKSQVKIMPNLVLTQEFFSDKDIYPTFTQGVVHYEAQIMYIYGEVYVTSQMPDSANHTMPTFRSAYLLPIYSQYKKNGGKVHENFDEEMYLFMDVKFDVKKTYQKLWEELSPYNEILTYRMGPQWHQGKLRIVFVGNAPLRVLQQERISFAAAQGTVDDINKNYDSKMMPVIGINFEKDFTWNGVGKMQFDEFMKFKDIIRKAHEQGKKVRVYNCPEEDNIWDVLVTAGVDFINCKNAAKFSTFLSTKQQ